MLPAAVRLGMAASNVILFCTEEVVVMSVTPVEQKIKNCLDDLSKKIDFTPKVLVVLGSGLGTVADGLEEKQTVDFASIKDFPVSGVSGHAGRFVFGYISGLPVAVMQGRVHYYEGYSMSDVVLPLRMVRAMGADTLVLTNSAGGVDPSFRAGDIMLITDHIASFVPSPLRGANVCGGERFPDMSHVYDTQLSDCLRDIAKRQGIELKEGIYLQAPGPQYENPAEVRFYHMIGAGAVGMSTACEAIAAVHCGYRVCGLSCIANPAAGVTDMVLTHDEVKAVGERASGKIAGLVYGLLEKMSRERDAL